MKLSSSDRKALVKLAGTLPKGSAERRAILAGLKEAAAPRTHPMNAAIIEALGGMGEATASELAYEVDENHLQITNALSSLLRAGKVRDCGFGRYTLTGL